MYGPGLTNDPTPAVKESNVHRLGLLAPSLLIVSDALRKEAGSWSMSSDGSGESKPSQNRKPALVATQSPLRKIVLASPARCSWRDTTSNCADHYSYSSQNRV
jgi:hypothetical protein